MILNRCTKYRDVISRVDMLSAAELKGLNHNVSEISTTTRLTRHVKDCVNIYEYLGGYDWHRAAKGLRHRADLVLQLSFRRLLFYPCSNKSHVCDDRRERWLIQPGVQALSTLSMCRIVSVVDFDR